MGMRYADSGVHIDRGDRFASFIKSIDSPALASDSLASGSFASGFELDPSDGESPIVLSTTDGVGTKILVARALGVYDTIGIDLVAMCVNDLVVHGARPVSFLDYIACGAVDRSILEPIMRGIVKGCETAGCRLSGGETAELPGMYGAGDFDLAGFAVGVVDKSRLLPVAERTVAGAPVFGLASSGIHSNGFSLARSVIPSDESDLYRTLLTPTRIYVAEVLDLAATGAIVAAAHITGGGLEGNITRVIPEGLRVELGYDWPRPPIFDAIQRRGDIAEEEMRRVFNLGVGMALVVARDRRAEFETVASELGVDYFRIGTLVDG